MKRLAVLAVLLLWPVCSGATPPDSPDLNITVGNTAPLYYGHITNRADGTDHNLTGDTITATMKIESVFTLPFVTPKILSAPCSIIDSTHGLFVYQWIAADTNTAGKYSIKFTITEAVGTTITTYTVPTNDKAYVFINNP